jgi:DNA-directed RNA polymerase sigma subunit (sigma70/sigma32)
MSGLCAATKRDGAPCRAFAMAESGLCAGHAGKGLAANPVAAAHQSALNRQTQAEVRKKRAIDVYREAVEEHAQSFVDARLQIINDSTAPTGDRLRAMEQLESRALGKPKESVTVDTEESDAERALRELTPEQRLVLWRRRGLRPVDEQTQEERA